MPEPIGHVTHIFLRPSARTPVKEVTSAVAAIGSGLEGDHAGGGNRQVTLLDWDQWRKACEELGDDLNPGGRRANVVVRGLDLAATRGSVIQVGDCQIDVVSELAPCRLMDDFHHGLQEALKPDCRGGVYGRVIRPGILRIDSPVQVVRRNPQQDRLPLENPASAQA